MPFCIYSFIFSLICLKITHRWVALYYITNFKPTSAEIARLMERSRLLPPDVAEGEVSEAKVLCVCVCVCVCACVCVCVCVCVSFLCWETERDLFHCCPPSHTHRSPPCTMCSRRMHQKEAKLRDSTACFSGHCVLAMTSDALYILSLKSYCCSFAFAFAWKKKKRILDYFQLLSTINQKI